LFLSLPTVKTHLARVFEKSGVTNRVQLALLVHQAAGAHHHTTTPTTTSMS